MTKSGRAPRNPISKRLRFEIYKRDKFTCVYCGRSVPEVVLTLDHVEAHASGGADDATNLVTACWDCNAGKSDVALGDVMPAIGEGAVDEMRERVEQMREYRKWRTEYEAELRHQMVDVWKAWCEEFDGIVRTDEQGIERYEDPRVPFPTDNALIEHLKRLPLPDVIDAVRIAAWRWRRPGDSIYGQGVVRYFYGVCRNKALARDEQRRHIRVTWDEMAAAVPELRQLADEVERFVPSAPWYFCGDNLWKDGWHINYRDGTRHEVASPVIRIAALVGRKSENARDPILGSQTAHDLAFRTIKSLVPPCGQACACGRPKRAPRPEDYPRCEWCNAEVEPIDRREACVQSEVQYDGDTYVSTSYGSEGWLTVCEIAELRSRYHRLRAPRLPIAPPRCRSCRTPIGGEHHQGCQSAACYVCGDKPGSGCSRRGHLAAPLDVSIAQALARMRRMKTRSCSRHL